MTKPIRRRAALVGMSILVSLYFLVPRNVTERQYDTASGGMVDRTVRRVPINLGLDLRGGTHLALEVDESKGQVDDCADAIRRAEHVVRTRMDELGTSERVVQVVGDCRLIVELPGVHDPARAREIVQRTAFLEFRFTDARDRLTRALPSMDAALRREGVSGRAGRTDVISELFRSGDSGSSTSGERADSVSMRAPLSGLLRQGTLPGEYLAEAADVATVEDWLALPTVQREIPRNIALHWSAQTSTIGTVEYRALYALEADAVITGEDLENAVAARDQQTNEPQVQFDLTRAAGRRFGEATGRNIGNHLAIVLDGRVQGPPPTIIDRIETTGRIRLENRTFQEASDLALVLRAGALPVPLQVVEERTLGPAIGGDSIRYGVQAAVAAVLMVLVVMGVFYKRAGLFAIGALFLYLLYCLAGLAGVGTALSLPGLAGFALSIGMAVDANVLIFERMREEMAAGKALREAVDAGFRNAMSAIVDGNVTTAITAAILALVGTGPVRGFAVTLLIGILASMVSAIFVTRTIFLMWMNRRDRATSLSFRSIRWFENSRFDFIAARRVAYVLTIALILPGALLLARRGITYSIEFTGGAMMQVQTAAPTSTAALRSALESGGYSTAEIQSFGSDRDYVIRARIGGGNGEAEKDAVASAVRSALDGSIGANAYEIERAERVGPKVGAELQQKAWIAILVSFAATLVYLALRFEWRFGLAAVLATAHDVAATIAFISLLDLEVSLVVVAAVLTVLGYSLNDTIVIFDRVRENMRSHRKLAFTDLLNLSINEVLPRTVLTGGTTLGTALLLSFFAGEVIRPFALVMSFGIVVGTFSSIFVGAPILLSLQRTRTPAPPARVPQRDETSLAGERV
jgi:protein-export membrane protein SecD/preprotein translocase SecF subunit